jgi:hypothetical protein
MSDYFIPRDYSLREQDLIPDDDDPCADCNPRCRHCGYVDVRDHRWLCRWGRFMTWLRLG